MTMKTESVKKSELLKGKIILIIEDDKFISKVYTKWVTASGAEVIHSNNGAQGLEIARTKELDLILLDLGMPGMNGYDTLMKLRDDPATKDIPVVILSNTTMNENREGFQEIIEAGVSGIFRKYETSLHELIAIIKKGIEENEKTLNSNN